MVPTAYASFFAVMAGVGATLFGLIFLAVSIRPDSTVAATTPVLRQVQVASSYGALLNPLVISLLALVPANQIGPVTLVMSAIALSNTVVMSVMLFRAPFTWREGAQRAVFSLGSFALFGYEAYFAVRLLESPGDVSWLNSLTTCLVIIYLYGIARAWDLIGARQFHLQEVLFSLSRTQPPKPAEPTPAAPAPPAPSQSD